MPVQPRAPPRRARGIRTGRRASCIGLSILVLLHDSVVRGPAAQHRRHCHRQFPRESHLRLAFRDFPAVAPYAKPELPQLGVPAAPLHDEVCGVHQEVPHESIPLLRDLLWLVLRARLVAPCGQSVVRPDVARVPEARDVAGEGDERRGVDRANSRDRLQEVAFLSEVRVAVVADSPVVLLDGRAELFQQPDLGTEQRLHAFGERVDDGGQLLVQGVRVAVRQANPVRLGHAADCVGGLCALRHDDLAHLDELNEVLVLCIPQLDGMEMPLVAVKQPCDLLRVAHVVLVRVPEDRPQVMGVPDVDLAAALPAECADPSAVSPRLHAEHGSTVAPEQRLEVRLRVGDPSLEHDVRLVVEPDDSVLFIP